MCYFFKSRGFKKIENDTHREMRMKMKTKRKMKTMKVKVIMELEMVMDLAKYLQVTSDTTQTTTNICVSRSL